MKKRTLTWTVRGIAVLAAAAGVGGLTLALAADRQPPPPPPPVHFRGLLNDYTPSAAVTAGGPYEMHGKWALDVDQHKGTATFSASMNMETSDYGIIQGNVDKDNPAKTRGAHTHHISMTDGVVSTDWSGCPAFSPVVTGGFVVTGTAAYVTGNGGPAPFGNPSPLTICILGGTNVKFSNFTMTFGAPATKHFGTQAIHGLVVWCAGAWELSSEDCTVQE